MDKKRFRKYTVRLVLVTLCLLLIVAGFNWVVNPYRVFDSPVIEGFNALKPQLITHILMSKAYSVRAIKPQSIILGTSRADAGIDPNHPAWSAYPVYNLGLSGANIYEIYRYFQHANAIRPLKQVVLMLDFFSFVECRYGVSDPSFEPRLSVSYEGQLQPLSVITDAMPSTISIDALTASIATITHQTEEDSTHLENGMRMDRPLESYRGYHDAFILTAETYMTNIYLPPKYQFDDLTPGTVSVFEYYRKILQIAYRDNIDLRMAISPSHVQQWETLSVVGLYSRFEEWKGLLVRINEEEATIAGKPPFPLWDFSVYCDFTTDPIPAPDDYTTEMKWYWDSSHYRKVLGDLLLDRVFGKTTLDFGVLLTSDNIIEHLHSIRVDQQKYRSSHPVNIAEIEELAKRLGVYDEAR